MIFEPQGKEKTTGFVCPGKAKKTFKGLEDKDRLHRNRCTDSQIIVHEPLSAALDFYTQDAELWPGSPSSGSTTPCIGLGNTINTACSDSGMNSNGNFGPAESRDFIKL